MPQFAPLRVSGGRSGLWRAAPRRRRAVAAGLAMTAAALAASGFREAGVDAGQEARQADAIAARARPPGSAAVPVRDPATGQRASPHMVSVPVRIADGATVRLLRPGDRVDVIAVPVAPAGTAAEDGGPEARVVAAGASVAAVPGLADAPRKGSGAGGDLLPEGRSLPGGSSARVVGSVPGTEGEGDVPHGLDELGDAGQSGAALLVLAVPRTAAADVVAAAATSRLAVVLC
ncbi:hypothetical protein J116_016450 [Streptomyces thermolilacinus SPC6]|uniref:Flp pilus assembly protein RcpC/CpaB domain-containing protein n=1 Tax=Streptomyces thermolilacinus SPC6 TaxID=1306406 RepID=A0A1D3DU27_9ACTN|nr:hypothetical protein J116_016450 [Streptomyces thermolilacinus SPC6]